MEILIVDDSLLDRKLLMNILKKNDINNEILQAQDGEQALQILSENYQEIGLIFLDWQMPKLSGLEVMQGIVKVPHVANIPIIMVTASGLEENVAMAKKVNPHLAGYVVKPYKPDNLLQLLKPILNKG